MPPLDDVVALDDLRAHPDVALAGRGVEPRDDEVAAHEPLDPPVVAGPDAEADREGIGGGSCMCAHSLAAGVSPPKGARPVRAKKSTQPSPYTSARASAASP